VLFDRLLDHGMNRFHLRAEGHDDEARPQLLDINALEAPARLVSA
jgi:hypothetical protein